MKRSKTSKVEGEIHIYVANLGKKFVPLKVERREEYPNSNVTSYYNEIMTQYYPEKKMEIAQLFRLPPACNQQYEMKATKAPSMVGQQYDTKTTEAPSVLSQQYDMKTTEAPSVVSQQYDTKTMKASSMLSKIKVHATKRFQRKSSSDELIKTL